MASRSVPTPNGLGMVGVWSRLPDCQQRLEALPDLARLMLRRASPSLRARDLDGDHRPVSPVTRT